MEKISPITRSKNITLEKTIDVKSIIEQYKTIKPYGIDVERFFSGINEISIYKCNDTGYRFYFPFNLTGDDLFYQQLEKNPWYYMDWKWEHAITEDFIKSEDKILEIGCAHGDFLEKIKTKINLAEGLEMNTKALRDCTSKKITAYNKTIEDFSSQISEFYDVVCSFQVLEHIADIKSFIDASISVLKAGGLLILSVPNNNCFFLKDKDFITNMPPHHMGLWSLNSLVSLQKYFKLRVEAIHIEPLQKYHVGFAEKIAEEKLRSKLDKSFGFFSPIIYKLTKRISRFSVNTISSYITGHTILVVFKKIN
jgi:2-polyprenyl-3-methyl-5-hydroxy-6-metoxy-1,4-benzoquinol methylase